MSKLGRNEPFAKEQKRKSLLRAKVYQELWADPQYQRIQEAKDYALRRWNQEDSVKNSAAADVKALARWDRRVKRILSLMYKYENNAMRKAGLLTS